MNQYQLAVKKLDLDKYYSDFIRDDESYKHNVLIYVMNIKTNGQTLTYVGNITIPNSVGLSNIKERYDRSDYWFVGDNYTFNIVHIYEGTANQCEVKGTFNKFANQKLLNKIKQEVVDVLNTNYNVQILPDGYDIFTQFGRYISDWKKSIRSTILEYTIDEFIDDFRIIMEQINRNSLMWQKYLVTKNRYWFISQSEEDVSERKQINFDLFTDRQKVVVIIMKEWLAMIVNCTYVNPHYKMHINIILDKLNNVRYKNPHLFRESKTNLFAHKTAIKLILSTMYSNSTDKQIEQTYINFMNWRTRYIKFIIENGH